MRVYKKCIYFTAIISVVSFGTAAILHYLFPCSESDFWINVSLGIFSGAILTVITSIISYKHERRRTLESFVYHTRHILFYLNKYQESMSIEQELRFYLDYLELNKTAWDMELGNMDFFFEKLNKNRKYVYEKIYKPILDFNQAVVSHEWHFRWYLDGSGKNDVVMEKFLSDLQKYLLTKTETEVPAEYDDNGNVINYCKRSSVSPKLVADISQELNGHYFEIMYGKKMVKKISKSQEEN